MLPHPVEHRANDPYVLLVDDDVAVLEVTRAMAVALGWRPLIATSANEALAVFRAHAARIGHVAIDLHMPVRDGVSLAREVRRLRGDVHITLMTGDEAGARAQIGGGGAADALLVKPFSLEDLEAALLAHAA